MYVTHRDDVPAEALAIGGAEGSAIQWLTGEHVGAGNFAMRLVRVAPGGRTPDHAHPWEHQWFVLAGSGEFVDATGKRAAVRPGSVAFVPEDERHFIENTGEEPLDVICLVRYADGNRGTGPTCACG